MPGKSPDPTVLAACARMGSAVFCTVLHCGTADKTNILPQGIFSLNESLLLDENPQRVKKKKENKTGEQEMLTIAQALQCLAYMGTEEMNTWSILLFPYFRRKEKFIPDSNTILCFI